VAAGSEAGAGEATRCPNPLPPAGAAVLETSLEGVVAVAAAVLMTGITPREQLSVVAGAG